MITIDLIVGKKYSLLGYIVEITYCGLGFVALILEDEIY